MSNRTVLSVLAFGAIAVGAWVLYDSRKNKKGCCCPAGSCGYLEPQNDQEKGKEVIKAGIKFYEVGASKTAKLLIIIPDVWGWSSGRIRAIADELASEGFYCVIPKLLSPVLEGGTNGDGLPPNFDLSKRGDEFLPWVSAITWNQTEVKLNALLTHLEPGIGQNFDISKKVSTLGFCWGCWALTKWLGATTRTSAIHKAMDKAAMCHPAITLEGGAYGGDTYEACRSVDAQVMLLPAGNDSDEYREGGAILTALRTRTPQSFVDDEIGASQQHGWVTRGSASDDLTREAITAAVTSVKAFCL